MQVLCDFTLLFLFFFDNGFQTDCLSSDYRGYNASGWEVCDTAANMEWQLKAANEMAERNEEWMGVARTPSECRELAKSNRLCVIIGSPEVCSFVWTKYVENRSKMFFFSQGSPDICYDHEDASKVPVLVNSTRNSSLEFSPSNHVSPFFVLPLRVSVPESIG
jgi:hypothetical protein